MTRAVAVVGASLAGLSAARALREQGFDGRVLLIGDEVHAPYDRPPLSKGFLDGRVQPADVVLVGIGAQPNVEWLAGSGLDLRGGIATDARGAAWSDQYGVRIQFAGTRGPDDKLRIVDGDVAARGFLAVYERDDVPVAILGMNQSRLFARWRRQLRTAPAR